MFHSATQVSATLKSAIAGRSALSRAGALARRFGEDRRGGVAVMFSIMLVPMSLCMGAAIDYVRLTSERAKLQTALDSTALAMAKHASVDPGFNVVAEAPKFFKGIYTGRHGDMPVAIKAAKVGDSVEVTGSTEVGLMVMSLAGKPAATIGSTAQATFARKEIELALVLDNTGSMSWGGKMTELKLAVNQMIDAAEKQVGKGGKIRISIVPYHTKVRVGAAHKNATWLDYAHGIPNEQKVGGPGTWEGCVTDRGESGGTKYDTVDLPPVVGTPASLHPAVQCAFIPPWDKKGAYGGNLAAMQPLTDDWKALRATVAAMVPDGYTNITIGAHWGLNMLTPGAPASANAAAFGTKNVEKYIVVLTDGDNTWNRYQEWGWQIDQRTTAMCNTIKTKEVGGRKAVDRLFTVLVLQGNESLLKSCASSPADYYKVQDASEISNVFKDIFSKISGLRITS
jgi:Flp pilus assembly protein TadG